MSSVIGEAFVAIRPDTTGFHQEASSGIKSSLGKVAAGIGGLFVLDKVKDQIGATIEAGSDLNETLNKTRVVFGQSSTEAEKFGDTAATGLGESKQAALEQLSTLGNLFVSLGLGRKNALSMGKGMVQLAADMGSFNNVPTEEALEAIRSGLVGETEPLRRFGVNMNEAALKAKALALGISDGTAQLTPAQRAQAAYKLILEQTKTAQGDFARTADGAANSQKTMQARTEDLKASIGQGLLPVYQKVLEVGNAIVGYLQEHQTQAKILAVILGTTLVAAFAAWAASAAAAAFATIVAMSPVLLAIAVIGLAIADVILIWQRFGPAIQSAVNDTIIPAINLFIDGINTVIDGLNAIPLLGFNIGHVGHVGELGGGGGQTNYGPVSGPPSPYVSGPPNSSGQVPYSGYGGFASGGFVGGVGNRDSVPAMLTPGEYVMSRDEVAAWRGSRARQTVNIYTTTPITDRTRFAVELHDRLAIVAEMAALG